MARTQLAAQVADNDGLTPVFSAANVDGHYVDPGDLVYVKNGSGAPITVTVVSGATYGGLAVADEAITIAAGADVIIGGLRADVFGQPSGADAGKVYIDFSAVTTVTCAAIRQ